MPILLGVYAMNNHQVTEDELRHGLQAILAARPKKILDSAPRLLLGDATKRGIMPKGSVDLVITSPPYNVGKAYNDDVANDTLDYGEYEKFSKQWLQNCYYWTRSTGRLCVNVSIDTSKHGNRPLSADVTHWAMKAGWKYRTTILWNEGNISRRTAWGSWKSASAPHIIAPVEVVIVLYKDEWKRNNPGDNDISGKDFIDWVLGIWEFNGESAKRIGHEAPYPRELPRRCLQLFSFIGDTVLDPFSGSGTTMIEAINCGRNALGIELEQKYCELSLRRLEKECGVKLIKLQRGGGKNKTSEIYQGVLDSIEEYGKPHIFVKDGYSLYKAKHKSNPSTNGRIFEFLICETLAQAGVVPFYYQTQFAFVPNADFDVALYDPVDPVVLSMKVSLRERYKQADLEGGALRQVYRRAKCYLITLSNDEALGIRRKIQNGDINGLDRCVLANEEEYTELIDELKLKNFQEAQDINPLKRSGTAFNI